MSRGDVMLVEELVGHPVLIATEQASIILKKVL